MAVQTITYDDKQYLNQNADIPAINKVQDTDMNEIKSVVNNNATETSTNTTNIANITGQILWTNPNPSQSISTSLSITLSSSNYDLLEIYYYQATSNNSIMYMEKIVKGKGTRLEINSADSPIIYRAFTYVDDTHYTLATTTSSPNIQNPEIVCIPAYIIGYKTGLFN